VTTTDISAAPTFTPYTVRPDIKNRSELMRALEREYPPLLRDAGIGGTVQVWFFIDEEGRVQRTQVNESSGHKALDDAAITVANIIEFTPALNRDKRVPVWISLPITFTTR
jgi:protein TonB